MLISVPNDSFIITSHSHFIPIGQKKIANTDMKTLFYDGRCVTLEENSYVVATPRATLTTSYLVTLF